MEASDGSGRVHIARSKTDQEAHGHVAYLTPDTAACLQRIKPADALPEERIFAMSARTIANRIKAAAEAAGIEGRFGGHSGRVGCAQDLAARGAGLTELQVAGRWQSAAMPRAVCTQPAGWPGRRREVPHVDAGPRWSSGRTRRHMGPARLLRTCTGLFYLFKAKVRRSVVKRMRAVVYIPARRECLVGHTSSTSCLVDGSGYRLYHGAAGVRRSHRRPCGRPPRGFPQRTGRCKRPVNCILRGGIVRSEFGKRDSVYAVQAPHPAFTSQSRIAARSSDGESRPRKVHATSWPTGTPLRSISRRGNLTWPHLHTLLEEHAPSPRYFLRNNSSAVSWMSVTNEKSTLPVHQWAILCR